MCDEIDCDCGGDCCDDTICCDCCCTSSQSNGTGGSSEVDHDCLYYLCCAGCILCPLFYVGRIKRNDEPITLQPESAVPESLGKKEDCTIAATTTISDATILSKNISLVPSTVTMDHDQLKNLDQNDPIESTIPMNRL
jgi:hypothetical protein